MEPIAQRWQCPKCAEIYESFIPIVEVACRRKHKFEQMKLVWGEAVVKHPQRVGRREVMLPAKKARPVVSRISAIEQLQRVANEIKDKSGEKSG